MKTLQETLRSTDPNGLIDAFLDQHPVDLMKDFADNQDLTLKQAHSGYYLPYKKKYRRAMWFKKMYEKELKAKKKQKGLEDH